MIFGVAILVILAIVGSVVDGCPYLSKQRQLKDEGYEGLEMQRMLRGSFNGISKHPHIRNNNDKARSCNLKTSSCYGKLFPDLPAFEADWFDLLQIGLPSPDADNSSAYMLEDFFAGADRSRTDEVVGIGNVNPTFWPTNDDFTVRPGVGPAGHTYLGQMFSHDVNRDLTTELGNVVEDANDVPSVVTAAADLDTMYGSMYKGKFKMIPVFRYRNNGKSKREFIGFDFPRSKNTGAADIFDERNDNTMVIAQIQILFQLYHNKVYDKFWSEKACRGTIRCFTLAREETVKTWQSIIAHDLLPNLMSAEVYNFMKQGGLAAYKPLFYKAGTKAYDEKRTPSEFSTCAYRVFHSRLAAAYQWGAPANFTGLASTFGEPNNVDASLVGGRHVDPQLLPMPWDRLFDLGQGVVPFTGHLLDVLYVDQLIQSPLGVPGNPDSPIELRCTEDICQDECGGDQCFIVDANAVPEIEHPDWGETASLGSIDFLRGQTLQLPGGLAMNEAARLVVEGTGYPTIPALTMQDIIESQEQPFGLPAAWEENPDKYDDIPCMLYMFIESIRLEDPAPYRASRLGTLGSYIVGEAALGFIHHADHNIFDDVNFKSIANGSYEVTMKDLIEYVGATPVVE